MGWNIRYAPLTEAAVGFTPAAGNTASGVFADGQSIRVTRAAGGFGTKPHGAKPWLYLPHAADLNPDANFSRGTAANLNHGGGIDLTTGEHPTNSAGSLRCLMTNANNNPGWRFTTPPTAVYVFSHRKFGYDVHHDAIGTNHKFFRLWADLDVGATAPYGDCFQSYTIGSSTSLNGGQTTQVEGVVETAGDNSRYWDNAAGYAANGYPIINGITTQWHFFEGEFQASSGSGVADGVGVAWLNGARMDYWDGLTTFNSTWSVNTWRDVRFSQISNNVEPAGGYFYYGPTLIEDSRCRIIISDEPTWETSWSTHTRDFCLPTAWADGEVTFTVRKGIHASEAGKYVYLVNSAGVAQLLGTT